jgi:hypothetical protein
MLRNATSVERARVQREIARLLELPDGSFLVPPDEVCIGKRYSVMAGGRPIPGLKWRLRARGDLAFDVRQRLGGGPLRRPAGVVSCRRADAE